MLLSLFLTKISSETINITDGILRYELFENKTASVLGRAKNEKIINLTIPQNVEYEGSYYTVISIADSSFADNATYGTLTLPDSLQYIGEEAFMVNDLYRKYDKLVGVAGDLIIPASIIYIGPYAFYNTLITSLNRLSNKLTNNFTKINEWVFAYSSLSGEFFLPDSIEEIGDGTFAETNITKINFPSSLKTIGSWAFAILHVINDTKSVLSGDITIPDSVTKIGDNAFCGSSITSFSIGRNITVINSGVFSCCCKLQTEINISNSITEKYIVRHFLIHQ